MQHRSFIHLLTIFCLFPLLLPPLAAIELTVVTFNIRYDAKEDRAWRSWTERIKHVVAAVKQMNPDIMGVQEALPNQVADLRQQLSDYDYFGVGRDDGKNKGEACGIFYRKSRFRADPLAGGTFWLSSTPDVPGSKSWGNEIPRIATWLHLIEISSGKGLTLFNTHWDHQHQGSREKSAVLLRQRIESRQHRDSPVVLLGDFNAIENNPAILHLTTADSEKFSTTFIETFQAKNPDQKDRSTFHFWKNERHGTNKIDHIFCSSPCEVKSATIIYPPDGEYPPSDHFPVRCEVKWK